jgi:hypothetical protein
VNGVYAGPARPTLADLRASEARLIAALESGSEQEVGGRVTEHQAAWTARFMPDLAEMDTRAGDPEAGQ